MPVKISLACQNVAEQMLAGLLLFTHIFGVLVLKAVRTECKYFPVSSDALVSAQTCDGCASLQISALTHSLPPSDDAPRPEKPLFSRGCCAVCDMQGVASQ